MHLTRSISLSILCALAALAAGCASELGAPTADPECQIQVEAERSPGYPFDLVAYERDVLPVLKASCASCHDAPDGDGGFTIWANAAPGNCDYARTFNALVDVVDLATPGNSPIVVAISGALATHPIKYDPGAPDLVKVVGYVEAASARWKADGGGDPAPPGASPYDYAVYQSAIQPILDRAEGRGCAGAGCHGTGAGGFTLVANPAPASAEMEANFIAVTSRGNLTTPTTSLVLLRATTRHASGGSSVATADDAAAILAWIEDAKVNSGGGGNVTCAPLDRFNVAVFRDEILPILRGAVDLNRGGGSGTGCTLGPCHGTDRGPGILHLSDALDAPANLRNFSCFVDLTNPSASEVLLCPLDDPRCRRHPHPGQDVFDGAGDLNYQRVLAYLYGSQLDATPLDFAFFVRRINTIFNDLAAVENGAQNRTCADTVGCHGVAVAGQQPPNGSNFPIIPNAADRGRLAFNFAAAAGFTNFLSPQESSLFLYPTNEIANTADHPLATGLPHPGGADFAPDSRFALDILRWAGGLRPDNLGFVTDWLVAGDYAASRITDPTSVDEVGARPQIFDASGASQFNAGLWEGLFSSSRTVDLNQVFPRDATAGRIAYAVVYVVNTTGLPITAQVTIASPNAIRLYAGATLVAQADNAGAGVSAIAQLPPYAQARAPTRLLLKVFQRATDRDFAFSVQLKDELGNPLTDGTQELVILLGPQGGI
jgi:hypothetical protein